MIWTSKLSGSTEASKGWHYFYTTQYSVTIISYFVADTHKKNKVGMAEHCTKLTPDDLSYDLKDLHIILLFLESLHVSKYLFD